MQRRIDDHGLGVHDTRDDYRAVIQGICGAIYDDLLPHIGKGEPPPHRNERPGRVYRRLNTGLLDRAPIHDALAQSDRFDLVVLGPNFVSLPQLPDVSDLPTQVRERLRTPRRVRFQKTVRVVVPIELRDRLEKYLFSPIPVPERILTERVCSEARHGPMLPQPWGTI